MYISSSSSTAMSTAALAFDSRILALSSTSSTTTTLESHSAASETQNSSSDSMKNNSNLPNSSLPIHSDTETVPSSSHGGKSGSLSTEASGHHHHQISPQDFSHHTIFDKHGKPIVAHVAKKQPVNVVDDTPLDGEIHCAAASSILKIHQSATTTVCGAIVVDPHIPVSISSPSSPAASESASKEQGSVSEDDDETASTGGLSSAASTAPLAGDDYAQTVKAQANAIRQQEWIATYDDNKRVMASFVERNIVSAADYYEAICDSRPEAMFAVSVASGRSYTYRQVDDYANAIAAWGHSLGWREGDAVALAMENCPRFIHTWIGLAKIGVTVACINTNISGEALSHAISVARCRAALVSLQQLSKWEQHDVVLSVPVYTCDGNIFDASDNDKEKNRSSKDILIASLSDRLSTFQGHMENSMPSHSSSSSSRPDRSLRASIKGTDALFYIYTSGTTGFSKAALFSHTCFIGAGVTWSRAMRLTDSDVFYVTLPLYHGNGGCVAVSAVLRSGACLVIREKFSVSNFLPDVRRYNCTATIYIGEMWRYMHNSPVRPDDAENSLRVACGNGLRGDIWRAVCDRFGISLIVEHYGQTEMPSAHPMINHYNVVGSCGYIPPSVRGALGTECLIKFDVDAGKPVRGKDGWCIRCGPGEAGEAIARLNTPYQGYTSSEAAKRAVYTDVFEAGDTWYHSGDLLSCDEDGFFYFVDRVGDTFRWKGENVATGEVCEAVGSFAAVAEANVYGVAVPGTEGRAGMASLVLRPEFAVLDANTADVTGDLESMRSASHSDAEDDDDENHHHSDNESSSDCPTTFSKMIDLADLYSHLSERLPGYARPLFLRIRVDGAENEKTSTFKFRKTTYQQQSFHPAACAPDLVFFRDDDAATFVPLTPDLLSRLMAGRVRI